MMVCKETEDIQDGQKPSLKASQRFPIRLHEMLCAVESSGLSDVVSWLPCGTMFKVKKHKDFAERVVPRYYRHRWYKSFLRQLSMYKFLRIRDGVLRGTYYHPLFVRGRLDLVEMIRRDDQREDNFPAESETLIPRSDRKLQDGRTDSEKNILETSLEGDNMSSTAPLHDDDEDFELLGITTDDPGRDKIDETPQIQSVRKLDTPTFLEMYPGTNMSSGVYSGWYPMGFSVTPAPTRFVEGQYGGQALSASQASISAHSAVAHDRYQPRHSLSIGSEGRLGDHHIPDDILEEIIKTFHVGDLVPSTLVTGIHR